MTEHGGDVYRASEETGIPIGEIIDFSASINPLGMPHSVIEAIKDGIPLVVHYPDLFAERLARRLALHLDIDPQSVLCGNGSTELIYLLARALAPRRVLIPAPTFSEYARACRMQEGTECVSFPLLREDGFTIDPGKFGEALRGCDLAFLCNPNNPTGIVLERDSVIEIVKAAERQSCRLIVDEAFIDFSPEHSVVREVAGKSGLIVLRSLTKFYALSGLRIGYAVLPKGLSESVWKQKEPWTVNTLAQVAAMAAIDDNDFQTRSMEIIQQGKTLLSQGFRSMGIEHLPPAANYFLLRTDKAGEILARLRKRGILLRDCSSFDGLDSSYLRVAVRSPDENGKLLRELGTICACAAL